MQTEFKNVGAIQTGYLFLNNQLNHFINGFTTSAVITFLREDKNYLNVVLYMQSSNLKRNQAHPNIKTRQFSSLQTFLNIPCTPGRFPAPQKHFNNSAKQQ